MTPRDLIETVRAMTYEERAEFRRLIGDSAMTRDFPPIATDDQGRIIPMSPRERDVRGAALGDALDLPSVDIREAARLLAEALGRPPWLSSIGVGGLHPDGRPSIVVFLRSKPIHRPSCFDEGWMGHRVIVEMFGDFAPLGGPA